jgi:predicted hotdog family 3-hydroxylacyl-ACP dehydratase
MSLPAPATLLRHREPALLIGIVETVSGDSLVCGASARSSWRWPEILEAAAQAAGLLAGLKDDDLDDTAVIAEYRDVRVHAAQHDGPLRLSARLDRRVLRFRQCRVEVRAANETLLVEGTVTLAPGQRARM